MQPQRLSAPSFSPVPIGILQRKCACGNHTVAGGECTGCAKNKSGLQRKLAVGASNDPLEREADRVADQAMAAPTHSAVSTAPPRVQRFSGQSNVHMDAVPASVDRVLASSGRPLDTTLQQDMGQRFGHDFSRVRVHSGTAAEQSARGVSANAYTVGHDIVFGAGLFAPGTREGRRLIAHELTHVVQQLGADRNRVGQSNEKRDLSPISSSRHQTSSSVTIQRQESGKPAPITARTVFPYPEKSRLNLTGILDDKWINYAASEAEDENDILAVRLLRASKGQEGLFAIVKTASDNLFEVVIPSVALPVEGNSPATTVKDVTLLFSLKSDGKFEFELKAGVKSLYIKRNITVSRSGGEFELSPPKGASAIVGPGDKSGQLKITGAAELGGFPLTIELLQLTSLPDVPTGSEEEKRIGRQITQEAKEARREPRYEFTLGAGARSGAKWDPVFAASWRVSLRPFAKTGGPLGLVDVPLRMDIEYAPDKSVLTGISTGGEFSLPTRIPVNVRVVGGWAQGKIEGTAPGGGKPPLLPAFGPTIGAGVGVGGKTFRMELDYQHLQNLAHSSPNVDTIILSGGIKF